MKKVLVGVFGVLFVAVVGVLVWKVAMPGAGVLPEAVATDILLEPTKLVVSQGQATVTRPSASPIKVTTELEVKQGDAIQVESTGKAAIEWSDGSITRLAGGTDMTITKEVVDAASGKQEAEVDVRSGQVWTKVLNVVQDDSSMQVRAQNTVAGIRGTAVYTSVSSTGVVMMPFEHGVEMMVEGAENRTTLIAGEGMVVKGKDVTKMGSGAVMNAFITASERDDKDYLKQLAEDRRKLFEEKVQKSTQPLPDRDAFEKDFKAQNGTAKEKANKLGGLMDRLVAEMLAARDAGDTVRLAELTDYYDGLVPLIGEAAAGDLALRTELRQRVQMHMAVLFSDGITDDDFLTRVAVAKAKMTLLDPNDDNQLRHVLRKELFFAADLAAAGKDRQVQEQLAMLRQQDGFQKPLMDNATDMDKEMFEKVSARLESALPSMTDGVDSLRGQLYSKKTEPVNDNQNTNLNQNNVMEETPTAPVENGNTNAPKKTNTNTNVRTNANTNAAKKTNTNTNAAKVTTPAVTAPAKTETKVTTPAPTNTLVPAPVRTTSTTTTTRPVVTQPK